MLQMGSQLRVLDNSGAKFIRCIRVLKKGTFSRIAFLGDVIVGSVQKLRNKNKYLSKVRKGDVVYAVIFKTRAVSLRSTGYSFKSNFNAVVLLSKQRKPIGTRVFGSIPFELRANKQMKVVLLGFGTV